MLLKLDEDLQCPTADFWVLSRLPGGELVFAVEAGALTPDIPGVEMARVFDLQLFACALGTSHRASIHQGLQARPWYPSLYRVFD